MSYDSTSTHCWKNSRVTLLWVKKRRIESKAIFSPVCGELTRKVRFCDRGEMAGSSRL
ncbi:hypothetical protein RSAG8_06800, partial [Rhizoctonia solani AG-8 WAC10335]